MEQIFTLINGVHWAATAVFLTLLIYSLQYQRVPVARALSVFFFWVGLWSFFAALISTSPELETKIFLNRWKMLGPVFLPVTILYLAAKLHGRVKVSSWQWAGLLVIPLISAYFLMREDLHTLLIRDYAIEVLGGREILTFSNGPWFPIHNIFSRLVIILAIVFIWRGALEVHREHRWKSFWVGLSIVIPGVADAVAVFLYEELRFIQITPTMTSISGVILVYAVLKHRVLDLVPMARSLVADTWPDPFVVTDLQKRVVDFNPAAEKIVGLRWSHVGRDISEASDIGDLKEALARLSEINRATTQKASVECWTVAKEGRTFYYEVSHKNITLSSGEHVGHLFSFQNVTNSREVENSLREVNELKTKIMGVLAHDLIGNIRSLSLLSEALSRTEVGHQPGKDPSLSRKIHRVSDQLVSFVEGILQWSRSQAVGQAIVKTPISLRGLAKEVFDFLEPVASVRSVRLINEVPPELIILGDSNMVLTILRNLVENAIKISTEEKQVIVKGRRVSSLGVEVAVEDDGAGLSAEQIEQVLSFQKGNVGGLKHSGGLGLILCDDFVTRHGGRFWAESLEGKGCRFVFTLPDDTLSI